MKRLISRCAASFYLGKRVSVGLMLLATAASLLLSPALSRAEEAATIEARLSEAAKFLSSDAMEGRGVGTKGIDVAADYIADQFEKIGLKTDLYDGAPFQKFQMATGAKLGEKNTLTLVGPGDGGKPQTIEFKIGEQFTPLAVSGSGKLDLPLVFVGYGITAKAENYDDYAGIDVKDKAVVLLRHEPQQNNPHSVFNGTDTSDYAPLRRKISNAYEHGAAAVIIVTDAFDIKKSLDALRERLKTAEEQLTEETAKFKAIAKPSEEDRKQHEKKLDDLKADAKKFNEQIEKGQDPLLGFEGAGPDAAEGRRFPVLAIRRSVLDPIVQKTLGTSLAQLETDIDKGPTPHSRELIGWRATGEITVDRQEVEVKNVVGVWEGVGPLADETIVIGAHYDHLGFGGNSSAAPGVKEVHNGADDNGSGTTVLLQVAREIVARGPQPRRIVFIAFTGEERGLIGSARYVREPLVSLDKTVAMLNLDMVGRLQDEKLIVHGTGTATEFDALTDRLGKQYGFQITKKPGGFGPSDHSSFYAAKVPVLFYFTGSHKDYHRPSDDFELLNIGGMRRVGAMVAEAAVTLAAAPARPAYVEVKGDGARLGGGGDRPYFGSIPDFSQDQPGYALTGVTKGGPAERGGLKAGDIIIQLGASKIGNLEDFDSALRKHKAGEKVPIVVKRGQAEVKLEVTLDPPK